jgi:hypothetical protein
MIEAGTVEQSGRYLNEKQEQKQQARPTGYMNGRNQKTVFRGERGQCPPILDFQPKKRGRGFEPPQIFGPATEPYCGKTPENAGKRRKTPENAGNDS